MNTLGQSALILAVTAFSLAISALSRNLKNKLVHGFAFLCTLICLWGLSFFLEQIYNSELCYQLHLSFNVLLAPAGLFFSHILTREESKLRSFFLHFSWILAAVLLPLQWLEFRNLPWLRSLTFFAPTFLVFECLRLMLAKTRRTWVYIGALVVLGTAVMDHVPSYGDVVPVIGNILLCIYLFLVSEAIIHQRLLNTSALINRVLILAITSGFVTLIFSVFVAWVENSPSLFILNTALASFVILMLVDPIKKIAGLSLVQVFNRKLFALREKVREAQRALIGVQDTSGLAQLTLQTLKETLSYDSASFFVLRSDGTKFRRIRGDGDEELANREVLANQPMFSFFTRIRSLSETSVLLDTYIENEIDRAISQAQRQVYQSYLTGLRGLNANLLIPFLHERKVLGFVVMKIAHPPEPWGSSWGILSEIYPYFIQASQVFKNTDIYIRQREKERLATLGEMSAGLAHEIRNPLGAIKGAAQLLEPHTEGAQKDFVNVIVEEVNRLNKVVTQFLDYSKPLPASADFQEMNVSDLLVKMKKFLSSYNTEIDFLFEELKESHVKIRCAPGQIHQVLVNFVQNSVHAITAKKLKQEIRGQVRYGATVNWAARKGKGEVEVFVEDNGIGIQKENLEKIFIPFFTTTAQGTGLGLSISSRIAEAHGGEIDVVSEEGKFTRFSMRLPLQ